MHAIPSLPRKGSGRKLEDDPARLRVTIAYLNAGRERVATPRSSWRLTRKFMAEPRLRCHGTHHSLRGATVRKTLKIRLQFRAESSKPLQSRSVHDAKRDPYEQRVRHDLPHPNTPPIIQYSGSSGCSPKTMMRSFPSLGT